MDGSNFGPKPPDKTAMTNAATYKKIKTPVIDTAGKKPAGGLANDPNKPLSPTNPLMVQKKDGSIGQWGNPVPPNTNQAKITLGPNSDFAPNEITQQHYDYIKNKEPTIPVPQKQGEGYQPSLRNEQADHVRSLMKKYPLPTK